MTEDKGILIRNIYYMLTYAFQELRKNNYKEIAGEEFEGVYDLFAEILNRGVSYQLKHGLHRRYVERQDSLVTLRGKLDINATMGHYTNGDRHLACEFDEYSEDNEFNRILKSTIGLLIKHPKVKNARRSALRKLLPFFSNVGESDLKRVRWNTFRFDRNSKTYQMLMYICYFIVDNLLLSTETGDYRMHSFSDEHMCRLYEKFVLEYYRQHHPEFHACARQISWNVSEESSCNILPIMQTDIFLTIGERTLIIDTKYYYRSLAVNYDKEKIHSANLYQIYSYVMNHDVRHEGKTDGMLLYAKTEDEIQPDGEAPFRDGNIIYFRTLDLNQDFENIKSQLESFVKLS